jgi:EAL domain-containing protein (putative c-di-GMP-specific phosphodiesterase class I)
MDVSPECLEIVRSVITLARSLGMEVVAEGVEQETHLTQLRTLGCEYAQGFLLARPMHAGDAGDFLRLRAGGRAMARPVIPRIPTPPGSNAVMPA